jgi:hypothetical protein
MEQKLFAFWEYVGTNGATYLGAEVICFTATGRVKVKGYDGMSFKPALIVPFDKGEFLLEKISELDRELSTKVEGLKLSIAKKRDALLNDT